MGQYEQWFVVQLVVLIFEFFVVQYFVYGILYLFVLCLWVDYVQCQLGGLQVVVVVCIEIEVCDQYVGVRVVVFDQVLVVEIGWGEDFLVDVEDYVLLFEFVWMQFFQVLVYLVCYVWQVGVVGVIDQIGGDQG